MFVVARQSTATILSLCLMTTTAMAQSQYSVIPPSLMTKTGQLIPSIEFPPPDSEQRIWVCLVSTDPIHRRGVFRWESRDRMIDFELHPAAPLFYRGAPASLANFPTGTMVEIWGYGDQGTNLPRNVLRMSDDFSVQAFANRVYQVESIDLGKNQFTVTNAVLDRKSPPVYEPKLMEGGTLVSEPQPSPNIFSFNDQTDWYLGDRIVSMAELAVGQRIQLNCLRYIKGSPPITNRCTEVWLDVASQDRATAKQLASFRAYQRDRAYPLRVDSVDDAAKSVTVTLLETGLTDVDAAWSVGQTHDFSASTTSLRMWEPNGGQGGPDRMFNVRLVDKKVLGYGYGSGGVRMTFVVPMMYEAYRPGSIIKLYPSGNPIPVLSIEERMPKEFDTFLRP
jgi:hypothetical protein